MGEETTGYARTIDLGELERIEQKLAADPGNLELMDWIAFMFYSNGVREKALHYYTRLAAARPGNPSYHYFLGNLHFQAGDTPTARECWSRVIQLDLEGEYAARARRKMGEKGRL